VNDSNEPIFVLFGYIKPALDAIYDLIARFIAFIWQCVCWVAQALWGMVEVFASFLVEMPVAFFSGLFEIIGDILGSIFD
jgi:phage-related protein